MGEAEQICKEFSASRPRWSSELKGPSWPTLWGGILQGCSHYAERFLRSCVETLLPLAGGAGEQAFQDVGKGKPIGLLTMGQFVELLVRLDATLSSALKKEHPEIEFQGSLLGPKDTALLHRLSRMRSDVAHPRDAPETAEDRKCKTLELLSCVESVFGSQLAIVVFALQGGSANATPSPPDERYEIQDEVGRGGMGVVYRARDRETNEVVALKKLRPEIAADPAATERLRNEVCLARRITHKNVCRVHDFHRAGEEAYISMEYVDGESLRSLLSRVKGLSIHHGLEILHQITAGLAEAHAQGVIHRDLKPENILITRDGTVKMTDFGIARSVESNALTTGTPKGTPDYMSPEQAQGRAATRSSDIYSLGLIMYEVFTGRRAFYAETPLALIHQQIYEPPEPPRSIEPYFPAFLERAVLKCLEKNSQKRFQSVAELEAALAETESPELEAGHPVLPPHLSSGRRSDAMLLILGALGLAGFIACTPQVIPETGLRVRLTRQQFQTAREETKRRGWEPRVQPRVRAETEIELGTLTAESETYPYDFLARAGHPEAQEAQIRLGQEFHPFLYEVEFPNAANAREVDGRIVYEPSGSIRSLELPLDLVPPGEGLPKPRAADVAQQQIEQAYGVNADQLRLEREEEIIKEEGRRGTGCSGKGAPPYSGKRAIRLGGTTRPKFTIDRFSLIGGTLYPKSGSQLRLITTEKTSSADMQYSRSCCLFCPARLPG